MLGCETRAKSKYVMAFSVAMFESRGKFYLKKFSGRKGFSFEYTRYLSEGAFGDEAEAERIGPITTAWTRFEPQRKRFEGEYS